METLILLKTWNYSGVTGYSEHIAPTSACETLVKNAMKEPGVYTARATSYAFGSGKVINAFQTGIKPFDTGWRF
jgi:hypothetical protein